MLNLPCSCSWCRFSLQGMFIFCAALHVIYVGDGRLPKMLGDTEINGSILIPKTTLHNQSEGPYFIEFQNLNGDLEKNNNNNNKKKSEWWVTLDVWYNLRLNCLLWMRQNWFDLFWLPQVTNNLWNKQSDIRYQSILKETDMEFVLVCFFCLIVVYSYRIPCFRILSSCYVWFYEILDETNSKTFGDNLRLESAKLARLR